MDFRTWGVATALAIALFACTKDEVDTDPVDTDPADTDPADTDPADTGDTDIADPLVIESVEHACEPDTDDVYGSKWDYTVTTSGPTSGAALDIDQDTNPAWEETHDLSGGGTTLTVHLEGANASPENNQTANESTLFQCGMESLMVWRATIYDPADPTVPVDCAVWSGAETDPSVIYTTDLAGCVNFNP